MRPPLLATALLFILTLGPSLWAVGRDRRPDTPLPTTARLSESTWSHVPAMVLENDYLRAVVIPRSGRLVSCYDKFSRRELLSEAGVAFTFGQNLPPGRPLSWRLTADGDASVSVWVGVTDASTGARWAVEYRLPSDLAGLYTIVRADNAGPDPLETGWSLAAAPATTPAGRMIRVAAGVHPASGDSWAFAGYYDPDSDSGLYALLPLHVDATLDERAAALKLSNHPTQLVPGQRREWVVQWVAVHRMGEPAWMAPDLAGGFTLRDAHLEARWCSFRFLNWLRLVVERDGAMLFDMPWQLQPGRPDVFLFPLTHPGRKLEARVDEWTHSRSLCRLEVLGGRSGSLQETGAIAGATEDGSRDAYLAACALLASGSEPAAVAAFQAIPLGAEYSGAALRQLAWAALRHGDTQLAAEMATAALAVAPADAQTLALRAHLHRRLGQREAAADDLRALAFLDPLSPFVPAETLSWATAEGEAVAPAAADLAQLLAHPGAAAWTAASYAAWGADRERRWITDHSLPPPSLFSDPVQDATP
ncbi:DUF5107 domain-containing protein [bacterium]|nr:DUF5107 domain-containing protein [bacterium]